MKLEVTGTPATAGGPSASMQGLRASTAALQVRFSHSFLVPDVSPDVLGYLLQPRHVCIFHRMRRSHRSGHADARLCRDVPAALLQCIHAVECQHPTILTVPRRRAGMSLLQEVARRSRALWDTADACRALSSFGKASAAIGQAQALKTPPRPSAPTPPVKVLDFLARTAANSRKDCRDATLATCCIYLKRRVPTCTCSCFTEKR